MAGAENARRYPHLFQPDGSLSAEARRRFDLVSVETVEGLGGEQAPGPRPARGFQALDELSPLDAARLIDYLPDPFAIKGRPRDSGLSGRDAPLVDELRQRVQAGELQAAVAADLAKGRMAAGQQVRPSG